MNRDDAADVQGVLLICGVAFRSVPMLVQFDRWLKSKSVPVTIIQLERKNRVRFVAKGVLELIRHRRSTVFLINPQALVVLRLVQCLPVRIHKLIYWAFESSSSAPLFSPVWAGIWAEKFIRRDEVDLIVPLAERSKGLSTGYRITHVLENVSSEGRAFIRRKIAPDEPIRLVMFGGLRSSHTYALEFIEMVEANPDLFELTLIGGLEALHGHNVAARNVICHGRMSHDDLIEALQANFHYSVVGYKPVSFNYRFCAPNKLFESYSLSLPVLANLENPTLTRLIADCGVLIDFRLLRPAELHRSLRKDYSAKQEAAFLAYKHSYNFEERADSILTQYL